MLNLSGLIFEDWSNLSARAKQDVRHAFVDFFAVSIAGKNEVPYLKLATYLSDSSKGLIPIIGSKNKVSTKDGATIWGTLGHALDFDDSSPIMVGHPSVVLIPALISLGYKHNKDGIDLFNAYIAGYEAIGRISNKSANEQYRRGWHNTSTIGIIGATVGAARLIGLDQNQTEHAIGISISLAGGIQENFGTMTKILHPGIAAGNAVFAVEMAKNGFESSHNSIRAYFSIFGEQQLLNARDRHYIEDGITFKPYPVCGCCTRAIDCILEITRNNRLQIEEIEKIVCFISPLTNRILQYKSPETLTEAKFSLEYCIAISLLKRSVTLNHFDSNDTLKDKKVVNIMSLVERKVLDGLHYTSFADEYLEIQIIMKDGSKLNAKIEQPKGFPSNPLTTNELKHKFISCLSDNINQNKKEKLFDALVNIDAHKGFASLLDKIVSI
jgi:2-methylcitrate dehydratase PrpD